jgi:hypothetical protein
MLHVLAVRFADREEYQSVILAELDGPRERRLQVHIFGE